MTTLVRHQAAGLIVSADRRLPGFAPVLVSSQEDLRLHLDRPPSWDGEPASVLHISATLDDAGEPLVTVSRSPHGFHFRYADRTRVWIAASGTDVWCTWPPTASLEDTCTYLSGPILGLVLRLRGALALHASAVQIGAGAVGFAGAHGAGKSTLAAALADAGCALVTDDVLHVRAEGTSWMAEPFTSMLKLWPDGARLALGSAVDLPLIAEGWDKRALLPGGRVAAAAAPLPLIGFACFGDRTARPSINPLTPGTALVHLAANSSAAHLLDAEARAAEFRMLSSLVRTVPCVTLTPPLDRSRFPAFVAKVLSWARDLRGACLEHSLGA